MNTAVLSQILSRLDRLEIANTQHHAASPTLNVTNPWLRGSGRGVLNPTFATPGPSAGRGYTVGDMLQGLPPTTPSLVPAEIVTAPLTSALQQLSLAIEPSIATSTKGIQLRPEYYIQHLDAGTPVKSLDHTKLTYHELVSGMARVLTYLHSVGGDTKGYLDHLKFVTYQAAHHSFVDAAYVGYDRYIVDKVVRGEQKVFVPSDTLGVSTHFHAGNFVQPRKPPTRGSWRGRGRRWGSEPDRGFTNMPDGFPEDICYAFNYKSCTGKCSKNHVCRICKGEHKAINCSEKQQSKK